MRRVRRREITANCVFSTYAVGQMSTPENRRQWIRSPTNPFSNIIPGLDTRRRSVFIFGNSATENPNKPVRTAETILTVIRRLKGRIGSYSSRINGRFEVTGR